MSKLKHTVYYVQASRYENIYIYTTQPYFYTRLQTEFTALLYDWYCRSVHGRGDLLLQYRIVVRPWVAKLTGPGCVGLWKKKKLCPCV